MKVSIKYQRSPDTFAESTLSTMKDKKLRVASFWKGMLFYPFVSNYPQRSQYQTVRKVELPGQVIVSQSRFSGAPAARRAAKRSPIPIWETKGNPWVDFLMVIMASGIARERVRTTTTTTATTTVESRKMAAILQITGWQRHATLVYCVLLWYWTSMLWSTDTCHIKVSADMYHVTISRAQLYS